MNTKPNRYAASMARVEPGRALAALILILAATWAIWRTAADWMAPPPDWEFTFVPPSRNVLEQHVLITNNTGAAAAPTLKITAFDSIGKELEGVRVRTAFGSDVGRLVVPSSGGADILAFDGTSPLAVSDVKVTVVHVQATPDVAVEADDVTAVPLDAASQPVECRDLFDLVKITNNGKHEARVRVAYLLYTEYEPRQQAYKIMPAVQSLVTVPAHGSITMPITKEAKDTNRQIAGAVPVGIQAYLSLAQPVDGSVTGSARPSGVLLE